MLRFGRGTSLTRRMLTGVGLPMILMALALGIGGALIIQGVVESVNDRLLGSSARAIAETIALEKGSVTLDLPPAVLGMLENDERDNVYYSVRAGGRLLTGYGDLAQVGQPPERDGETSFDYSEYRGFPIRISAVARKVPQVEALVIVQVAETLEARHALRNRLLAGLAALELVLLIVLLVLLPMTVKWGLAPLSRVLGEIEQRQRADFTPLAIDYVPAELCGLIGAFNGLLGRFDQAVRGIRRFTGDASHQMRTPLSILRAHIAVLKAADLPPGPGRQSVADIDAATLRLQRLLTQLLALARAEGARDAPSVRRTPSDLVDLTRKVAIDFGGPAVERGVDLQFDAPDASVMVLTQSALAAELVANLVDNAIRYNRPGGTVWVAVGGGSQGGIVTIEDQGPGIAPEARERAFERFERLAADHQTSGTGLGLAIVQALADSLGVQIYLADGPRGSGLRVEVHFPRAHSDL